MLDIVVAALAMVLVVSGVLKVRDPESVIPMLAAVGLPATRAVVCAVALAEILVGAVALVIGGPAATAALALLYGAFAVVSLVLLRSGDTVSCGCFGQRSATMTPLHVGVNAAAAVVALAAAALGAPGLYGTTNERSLVVAALASLAAALLAAVIVALLAGVAGRVGAGATPARLGPVAPGPDVSGAGTGATGLVPITGVTPEDEPVTVTVAGTGQVTLLVFLTTGCTSCLRFWDALAAPGGAELPGDATGLVVVTRGDDQENPNRVRDLAPDEHLVVRSTAAWLDYGVAAGPYFVLADGRRDRILGEGTATAWGDVAALVAQAAAAGATDAPPPSRSTGVAE